MFPCNIIMFTSALFTSTCIMIMLASNIIMSKCKVIMSTDITMHVAWFLDPLYTLRVDASYPMQGTVVMHNDCARLSSKATLHWKVTSLPLLVSDFARSSFLFNGLSASVFSWNCQLDYNLLDVMHNISKNNLNYQIQRLIWKYLYYIMSYNGCIMY